MTSVQRLTVHVHAPSALEIRDALPYALRKLKPAGARVFATPVCHVMCALGGGWIVTVHAEADLKACVALMKLAAFVRIEPYVEEAIPAVPPPPVTYEPDPDELTGVAIGPPPFRDWPIGMQAAAVVAHVLYYPTRFGQIVRSKLIRRFG